jgi:flagellar motor switch protein FliN
MSPDLQDAVEETTVDNATAMDTPRDESAASNTASDVHGAEPNDLEDDLAAAAPGVKNIGVLLDIDMKVTVELGRAQMKIRDIMNLSPGSVVELGRSPAEPVDILVNGVLLARGEVVVVDEQFSVRINKLLSRGDRIRKLI